eukprot:4719952-Pyramimonas_sp.AAC.1
MRPSRDPQEVPGGTRDAPKAPGPPRGPQDAREAQESPNTAPRAPKSVPRALQEGPFLCLLPTFLIEAITLGIVSGWAGG